MPSQQEQGRARTAAESPSPQRSRAEDRPLPTQLTPLVARCRNAANAKEGFAEETSGLEASLDRRNSPRKGDPQSCRLASGSPARETPGPAGLPAHITFPARHTHGTCRLLLGASTAMKRHRGFCQKTKRQRQSWGWGKLSTAREDPCRDSRMLLGSTATTHPCEPKVAPLARCRESGGWVSPHSPPQGSMGWEVLEDASQAQDNSWPQGENSSGLASLHKKLHLFTSG